MEFPEENTAEVNEYLRVKQRRNNLTRGVKTLGARLSASEQTDIDLATKIEREKMQTVLAQLSSLLATEQAELLTIENELRGAGNEIREIFSCESAGLNGARSNFETARDCGEVCPDAICTSAEEIDVKNGDPIYSAKHAKITYRLPTKFANTVL